MKTGNYKDGRTGTRLYNIYRDMKKRCNQNNNDKYGGRGIYFCREWDDYDEFFEWAIRNGYRDDLTLERVDNERDYSPNNCKWIPKKPQARNRRTTKWITIDGETKSLAEWCEIQRVPYATALARINRLGWPVKLALHIK